MRNDKGFTTITQTQTDIEHMLNTMNAGVFKEKIEASLNAAAAGVVNVPRKAKAKVQITLTIEQVGDGSQVIVSHQLSSTIPTNRGQKSEVDVTETPYFVGRGGKLTFNQPEENDQGQYSLEKQADGILKNN